MKRICILVFQIWIVNSIQVYEDHDEDGPTSPSTTFSTPLMLPNISPNSTILVNNKNANAIKEEENLNIMSKFISVLNSTAPIQYPQTENVRETQSAPEQQQLPQQDQKFPNQSDKVQEPINPPQRGDRFLQQQQSEKNIQTTISGEQAKQQQSKIIAQTKFRKFIPSPELTINFKPSQEDTFYPSNYKSYVYDSYFPINLQSKEHQHGGKSEFKTISESTENKQNLKVIKIEQQSKPQMLNDPLKYDSNNNWQPWQIHSADTFISDAGPKNRKGKWKWVPDEDENGDALEGRIINNYKNNINSNTPIHSFHNNFLSGFDQWFQNFKLPSFTSYTSSLPPFSATPSPLNQYSYTYEIPTSTESPYSFDNVTLSDVKNNNLDLMTNPSMANLPEWFSVFPPNDNKELFNNDLVRNRNSSPWKKIIHVLSAAIPIGLLISALTPQVFYVKPNSTVSDSALGILPNRLRALDDIAGDITDENNDFLLSRRSANPLMDLLQVLNDNIAYNVNEYNTTDSSSCDDRHFCEISRSGMNGDADVLSRMLWKIANETPTHQATKSGLDQVFGAIKQDNCNIFKCSRFTRRKRKLFVNN